MLRNRLRQMEALFNRLGAIARHREPPARRRMQTAQDVIDLLEEQVQALRTDMSLGTLEKAQALAYVAGIARRAIETGTVAARLEQLQRVLNDRVSDGSR